MKERRRLQCIVVASMLCLLAGAAAAGETESRTFAIFGQGELQLNIPVSWTAETTPATAESPAGIQFGPKAGAPFEMVLTPVGHATGESPAPGSAVLKKLAQDAAELLKPRAVERTIDVREIRSASGAGYYFFATDRAPKPGEFKIATQGFVMVGNLLVSFTILTNDGQRHVIDDALEMIRNAKYVAPSSSALPAGYAVRGGYWLDMHISKVESKDSDKPLFDNFVNSITLFSR